MHFEENGQSRNLISLSPLPSAHPSYFQLTPVRTSTRCYPRFILAKGRSSRFASIPSDSNAHFGLAFAAARLRLTSPLRITSRLIMQKARGQAFRNSIAGDPGIALPLLVGIRFQELFHSRSEER